MKKVGVVFIFLLFLFSMALAFAEETVADEFAPDEELVGTNGPYDVVSSEQGFYDDATRQVELENSPGFERGLRTVNPRAEDLELRAKIENREQIRVQVKEGVLAAREGYREEVRLLKAEAKENQKDFHQNVRAIIEEAKNNPDLTDEEKVEIRAEIKALKEEYWESQKELKGEAGDERIKLKENIIGVLKDVDEEFELSNGQKVRLRVAYNQALENAMRERKMDKCSEENECELDVTEVEVKGEKKAAYVLKHKEQKRFLWIFRWNKNYETSVDAQTGEVI